MKKVLFAAVIFILEIADSFSQNLFLKRYDASAANYAFIAYRIGELPGNEFAMIATLNSQERGALFKLDNFGNPMFCKIYSADSTNNYDSNFDDLTMTQDSSLIIIGQFENAAGVNFTSEIKTDNSGNIQWAKRIGAVSFDDRITRTMDNYYVAYISDEATFMKTDVNGNLINQKKHSAVNFFPYCNVMRNTNDYGVFSCGRANNNAYLMKVDSSLNLVFAMEYPDYSEITDARQTLDSGFVCVLNKLNQATSLMKTDATGNPIWCLTFSDSTKYNYGGNVMINPNNTISFLIRWYKNFIFYAGIFKIDMNGNVISGKDSFGVWNTYDWIRTSDGRNCLLTVRGSSNSSIYPNVIMTDSILTTLTCLLPKTTSYAYNFTIPVVNNLSLITTAPIISWTTSNIYTFNTIPSVTLACVPVNVEENKARNEILIFPNPATDYITIQYNLTSAKETTVEVFNIYGQMVDTQNIASLPAGKQEIQLSLKGFPAGIYFVKINVNGKEEVKKAVKL